MEVARQLSLSFPAGILIKEDVVGDLDVLGPGLEHAVCLGTFLVADEDN
jgi:hypothetical protein